MGLPPEADPDVAVVRRYYQYIEQKKFEALMRQQAVRIVAEKAKIALKVCRSSYCRSQMYHTRLLSANIVNFLLGVGGCWNPL